MLTTGLTVNVSVLSVLPLLEGETCRSHARPATAAASEQRGLADVSTGWPWLRRGHSCR